MVTLFTGIWGNPWGIDLFDIDFLTILTAYLFFPFGPVAAGIFALGQGLLIDVFSGGLKGLFTASYLVVFFSILVGSRFFNLLNPKGQFLIVSLSVLIKNVLLLTLLHIFSWNIVFSKTFLWVSIISVCGSGFIAPFLFKMFDQLAGIPTGIAGKESTESP